MLKGLSLARVPHCQNLPRSLNNLEWLPIDMFRALERQWRRYCRSTYSPFSSLQGVTVYVWLKRLKGVKPASETRDELCWYLRKRHSYGATTKSAI